MGLVLTLTHGEGFTITTPEGEKLRVELTKTNYGGIRLNIEAPQTYRISRDTTTTREMGLQDHNPENKPELKVVPGACPECNCLTVKVRRASATAICSKCSHSWAIVVPRV